MTRRSWFSYGVLLSIWLVLVGWQAAEHVRVQHGAQAALVKNANEIGKTLGLVLRSQRRFGVISKERIESALTYLVDPVELPSVQLLNNLGDEVAAYGAPIDPQLKKELQNGPRWDYLGTNVILEIPLYLGTNVTQDLALSGLNLVVVPNSELFPTNRTSPGNDSGVNSTNVTRRRGGPRRGPGRPPWMTPEEYSKQIESKGVHSFILVMSNQPLLTRSREDLLMRSIIALLATVSVLGVGLAWRNLDRSSELQIRLVRASELNSHLKQMNLAAAGLAHETRNPLNIIRGLAQMMARQPDASAEISRQCRDMIDETDRVTAQLNEFINYSRPREIRYADVSLRSVVAEIARTLGCDLEEKQVKFHGLEEDLVVKADEALIRQALFNLALNAIQAAEAGGEIRVSARKEIGAEASVEVRDNGPGVPPDQRAEVFKPYFTTHKKGTGLGLAVVHQIVRAHGWDIECLPNEPKGAIFRISHLKLASAS
jgi:signal transduction histidine kinase